MKSFASFCAILAVAGVAVAQDGLYGTFIVGQKFVNLAALNDSIAANSQTQGVAFASNNWTFGGEGHMIIAKNFVLGGKGFGFSQERAVPSDSKRRLRISGGMGVGTLGYAFLGGEGGTFRLIPQIGVGVAPFLFQSKRIIDSVSSRNFSTIFRSENDNMAVLAKAGLVLDGALSIDWYMKFIHLLSVIPGLECGPLLHAEVGYTYIPVNLKWMRDVDQLSTEPNMKFDGFYFNVGIGLGFSTAKNPEREKEQERE